ncbi:MAG: hypothetical protein L0229_03840 [Blastocatellia bacterium]|nr:hypothetical protein [Blastocatellia bacterium]
MSAKPYDQAFKYLAEQDAESLLILLGHLKPGQQARIELLPRELIKISFFAPPHSFPTSPIAWKPHRASV